MLIQPRPFAPDPISGTLLVMKPAKPSQSLTQLLINIAIPTFILIKGAETSFLSPVMAFSIAISIPLLYGAIDYIKSRTHNLFALIGLINIALTGTIGLLELDPKWLAVKEAGVPFVLGLAVLISAKIGKPFLTPVIEFVFDIERIQKALKSPKKHVVFERKVVLSTYMVAVSFFLSSLLNYLLAKLLVQSPPGTVEFNQELGRMTALSFPVIALPSTLILVAAIWMLLRHIRELTGLSLEEIIRQ